MKHKVAGDLGWVSRFSFGNPSILVIHGEVRYIHFFDRYAGNHPEMKLSQGHHLAYCTNVHRGNNWTETFSSLVNHVMQVRTNICPEDAFAIGLRLGADATSELAQPVVLKNFKQWLDEQNAYVFTINGFPYGNFHGQPVKEDVYRPDWTEPERLSYTISLFEILSTLLPAFCEGSVSTLPASFKEFYPDRLPESAYKHLLTCAEIIEMLSIEHQIDLHLGLEPEPLGWFENTPETLIFFNELFDRARDPELVRRRIGVNYDCCHLAVEFEDARTGLNALQDAGIRLSKLHISSALKTTPCKENLEDLKHYVEEVYLHQVIAAKNGKVVHRCKDLDLALNQTIDSDEWRIHYHVPLHSPPGNRLSNTSDHVNETLDWLAEYPQACKHLEMETYTWEVLPENLRSLDVVEQVTNEYHWTLGALQSRGLGK